MGLVIKVTIWQIFANLLICVNQLLNILVFFLRNFSENRHSIVGGKSFGKFVHKEAFRLLPNIIFLILCNCAVNPFVETENIKMLLAVILLAILKLWEDIEWLLCIIIILYYYYSYVCSACIIYFMLSSIYISHSRCTHI